MVVSCVRFYHDLADREVRIKSMAAVCVVEAADGGEGICWGEVSREDARLHAEWW